MVRVSFRGFTFHKYSPSLFEERFRLFHRLLEPIGNQLAKIVSHKGCPSLRAAKTKGDDRSGLCSISSFV